MGRRRGGGKRKKKTTKEGKTRINLQAEETRDNSWLPRDTVGFITHLIKSRGMWPDISNTSLQGHWVWTKSDLCLFHLPLPKTPDFFCPSPWSQSGYLCAGGTLGPHPWTNDTVLLQAEHCAQCFLYIISRSTLQQSHLGLDSVCQMRS